jgi:hypothetical protein
VAVNILAQEVLVLVELVAVGLELWMPQVLLELPIQVVEVAEAVVVQLAEQVVQVAQVL